MFVYVCVVHSFKKEDFLKNSHILSCLVRLKSILLNLLCVFDLFQNTGSQHCFRFYFFLYYYHFHHHHHHHIRNSHAKFKDWLDMSLLRKVFDHSSVSFLKLILQAHKNSPRWFYSFSSPKVHISLSTRNKFQPCNNYSSFHYEHLTNFNHVTNLHCAFNCIGSPHRQSASICWLGVDAGLWVYQLDDPLGWDLSLASIWSKGAGIPQSHGAEDYSTEHPVKVRAELVKAGSE